MVQFSGRRVTMMLALILATGPAVSIIACSGETGALANGSGGVHSVGENKLSLAVAKIRDLQSELGALEAKRTLWDVERALALTEKAYDAGCQREFLESLVDGRALQGCNELLDMVIFALSCVTVYNSAPESEWKSFAPIFRMQPVVAVNGREAGASVVKAACRSGWRPKPHQVMEIAFLAIDAYRDQRARDLLRKLASRRYKGELRGWFPMLAWQLLLNYEGAGALKPDFEKAIEAAAAASSHQGSLMIEDERRRLLSKDPQHYRRLVISDYGYITAMNDAERRLAVSIIQQPWLKELEFVESLEADRRERYLQIRRTILRILTQADYGPRPRADPIIGAKVSAAMWLPAHWEDGDERFLPHLLETGRPVANVIIEAPISEAGLAWLKEQAESGPWSDDVKEQIRWGLEQSDKRQKPLERQEKQSPQ